ncbi:MAG: sigma-70 family RNA polymerase sigma factor [Verrucomicrobiales bacterium]|nr:sigma-70 family RNA polymerase sigma factor [Verrucomicrobiales bacterium]
MREQSGQDNGGAAETDGEAVLVRRARAGELAAFEELVSRHEGKVFSLAWRMLRNRHDAEDITQQTFMKAVEHLDTYRGEAAFGTWLMRIATYAALKIIRKRGGLEMVSLEASTEPDDQGTIARPDYVADWRESPDRLVRNRETGRVIEDALGELDEKHRLVFLLRDVEGLSVRETAGALGISEANVKVRLLRARLQLREKLTRLFGDPATQVRPHALAKGPHTASGGRPEPA